MVPSIRIHRPSSENAVALVDAFNDSSIALDEVLTQDSGAIRPLEDDEMTNDFGMNGISETPRHKKMSPREERMKWWRIYAMHFLFSWNSRTFEYVSVGRNAFVPPRSTC